MDKLLALRLDPDSPLYDSALYNKLSKLAKDYVFAGVSALDYYLPEFDVSNDLVNCFAPINKADFEKRDRSDPENFIHPMGATEVTTLATFISQILFGGEVTRKVEPRNPDDEDKADVINELLAWNDNQQATYAQGYHWVWDAITFNRGVMYDRWKETYEVQMEAVEYELPYVPQIDPETGKKIKKPKNYEGEKVVRFRKKRVPVGGFCKIDLISPYDFVCDPSLPMSRFQEGRFAGHRVILPWQELKRRSELPPDNYEYVLPSVVERLKAGKGRKTTMSANPASTSMSRSYFERNRRTNPSNAITGSDKVNKEDGGVVECWSVIIRARPKAFDIFEEDDEDELLELLIAGESELLSVNVLTNKHDQYPYAVGEARPNAHTQFAPSWAMILKGPQDYVDYLKNRRKESLARTSGNIFLGNPAYVDFQAFTDPKKDGLMIPVTQEGAGKPLDQVLKQIPVVDTTARFHEDMQMWIETAELATGAHAAVQGQTSDPGQTATQFAGVQQMAQGRISTLARLLSSSALVPQTERIVSNLQQFLPDKITIRVTGDIDPFNATKPKEKFLNVIRDASALQQMDEEGNPLPMDPSIALRDIQGTFDVVPHDGALPDADVRKVAAMSRAIEAFSTNPALQSAFDITKAGSIDPVRTFRKLIKMSGMPLGGLIVTEEEAAKNAQEQLAAQGGGLGLPPAANPQAPQDAGVPPELAALLGGAAPAPVPQMETEGGNIPSAEELPPVPSAEPPLPGPLTI